MEPFVTIAIPTSDDEPRIKSCLETALGQDYPRDRLEVIVADAMSMDATRELVLRVAAEDARVRLVDNPDRTRAAALNVALQAAKGEIVVPLDPGVDYARTHVAKCVEALSTSPAEHLTIVPRSAGRTLTERALSAVQRTRLAFAAGTELADGSEPVPAFIGALRRRVFERVGMYDPGMKVEEDVDLARRIAAAGGAVTVRRDIVVHKADASSFRELFEKHFQLGKSRARSVVREKKIRSVRELTPLAIVGVGAALGVTSSVQPITPFAAGLYALVTGASAVRVGRREGIVTIPIAWAAYPVMHLAHGVGFGAGFVRAIAKRDLRAVPWIDPKPA
jgi:cellulose synthase/poly-beta-1,6-N-acetylglucosamine synthase-like glycosyltransferase